MGQSSGYKIRKIREIKNISREYMAKHLGISRRAYSYIEKDKVKIDEKQLMRIAAALKVKTDVIENFNVQTVFKLWLSVVYEDN